MLSGVPPKHQAVNHKVYAEDLAQTHSGCMIASSVSMSSHDPCLVDAVGCVCLVSLTPLVPTVPPPPPLWPLAADGVENNVLMSKIENSRKI